MLNGELEYAKFNKDSILSSTDVTIEPVDLAASKNEIELRKRVSEEEKSDSKSPAPSSKKKTK